MSANQLPPYELLPSGKKIRRRFDGDGSLIAENHGYGMVEIAIELSFSKGVKTEEMYFVRKRLVGRKAYEKARVNYQDMPPADFTTEDFGSDLLRDIRALQRQKKIERESRLAASEESLFPRPTSTNWLRLMAPGKAHLVVFASRDWKILSREPAIPTGREWLQLFGFGGPAGYKPNVAKGVEIGFEVPGNRDAMLKASKSLLSEVAKYVKTPPETSSWQGSIRPRPKPRKKPELAWLKVLPPLIDFLSNLQESKVKVFNHHQ